VCGLASLVAVVIQLGVCKKLEEAGRHTASKPANKQAAKQ